MTQDNLIPPGDVEKVIEEIAQTIKGDLIYVYKDTPDIEQIADYAKEVAAMEVRAAFTTFIKEIKRLRDKNERLRADLHDECFEHGKVIAQRDASQSQAEAMKAELDLLRDECRAKSETIFTMQGRIDWAYTLRDAAVASHEGQKRNTEAFRQERDEARSQAEAMKAALEAAERLYPDYGAYEAILVALGKYRTALSIKGGESNGR